MAEKTISHKSENMIRRLRRRLGAEVDRLRERREFRRQYLQFRAIPASSSRFSLRWEDRYPCMGEMSREAHSFDRHYVYHTSWAARVLARSKPNEHVDFSSSLYFSGIVSAFVPIRFYDLRPPDLRLEGLNVGEADLLSLPFPTGSIPSLSCMHVVEHIGLGRYGDLLDPEGDLKAIDELIRVTAPGGSLLFVVPVGRPRLMFNAHRIYAYYDIVRYFKGMELVEFVLIPENEREGGLLPQPEPAVVDRQSYGCGCFWFKKPI
jgi:SAM-dependent methyltransferase